MLEELGVPSERVTLPSPPPHYYTQQVNPLGLVPAIRDSHSDSHPHSHTHSFTHSDTVSECDSKNESENCITLSDSNAICVYLSHKYGRKDLLLFPSDSRVVGRAYQWADFIENYFATPRFNVVFHALVNEQYPPSYGMSGRPSDEEIEKHIDATVKAMSILDTHLSSSSSVTSGSGSKVVSYIASKDQFTFADAVAAPWIHRWHTHATTGVFGVKLSPDRFENVQRYYHLIASRPAFRTVFLQNN